MVLEFMMMLHTVLLVVMVAGERRGNFGSEWIGSDRMEHGIGNDGRDSRR